MHDNETNKWLRIHQLGVNRKRTRTVLDKTLNGFLLYYFVSHEVIDIPFIITGLAIHFISNLWDLRYCLYVWIQTCQEIHISRFIFGHHGPFFHSSDKRKAILKIRSLTVQNKKFTLFLSKTRIRICRKLQYVHIYSNSFNFKENFRRLTSTNIE